MFSSKGFALIEAAAAIAILGMGIIALIELFSGGLRLAHSSEKHAEAVMLAKNVLAQQLIRNDLREGAARGSHNGFEWEARIEPFKGAGIPFANPSTRLYRIGVKVKGTGAGELELATVKAVFR